MRLACSMIASHGCSASVVYDWHVRPAAWLCWTTACTRSEAMRSCASKNSCGGVGCISEMALYGNGSFTLIV